MARTRMSLRRHFGNEPPIGREGDGSLGRVQRRGRRNRWRFNGSPCEGTSNLENNGAVVEEPVQSVSNGESLADLAERIFAASPYAPIRRLKCTFRDGEMVIAGSVDSFYLKQLAQIAVQKVAGVVRISNIVEVSR
jgi:hypothetical protein